MAVFVRKILFLLFLVAVVGLSVVMGAKATALAQEIGRDRHEDGNPKAQSKLQSQEEIKITLAFEKQKFTYTDSKIIAANHLIAEEIYARKINASYREKRAVMNRCLSLGGTFKNAVLYTMPRLESVVDSAIKLVNLQPKDSEIIFNPDRRPMFSLVREKNGRSVNEEDLYMSIYSALTISADAKITIRPVPIAPKVTIADSIRLTSLRARYSTSYGHSNENRKGNIRLALKKINGTTLGAGEEFSFNKIVGKRTEANGFKESNIIVMGKYEKGTGGGVCQASTTIYNAALLAGLKITYARNHSLECSYELPSFDAMVSAGSDLRFVNDGKTPVFIRAYGTADCAIVEIYGERLPYTIKRKSEIISRKDAPDAEYIVDNEYKYHDKSAQSGQEKVVNRSHGELKSAGYLLYYDLKGFFIKSEKIRTDTYQAVKGLVAVAP